MSNNRIVGCGCNTSTTSMPRTTSCGCNSNPCSDSRNIGTINTSMIQWSGGRIVSLGVEDGDPFESVVLKIATAIENLENNL